MSPKMMKSYIWLQTPDGSIQEVEEEIGMVCPYIRQEMQSGGGSSKNCSISLPEKVTTAMLSLIIDYCRFHLVPGRSTKELKLYDEKFVRMHTERLCDLASAANSLKLRPLVDLTSRTLARMIEGKSTEEIRETFNIPDDLTEEEKLEPLQNRYDDPHVRRLNILYARKRKELQEKKKLKDAKEEEVKKDDARSVDDLLSFINGEDRDSKGVQTSKNKKKNRRRKDQQKNVSDSCKSSSSGTSSPKNAIEIDNNVSNGFDSAHHSVKDNNGDLMLSPFESIKLSDSGDDGLVLKDECDDCDIDDEIDPALKEQIDREVEDFARRLNSDWSERIREILSLGQEKRPIPRSSVAMDR